MDEAKTHRVDDRIVSLTQPHVRPIIRGKAGVPVGFGAKLAVIGQAKRRFSLARVMAKLAETAQSAIVMIFLVLNWERWLRELLRLFWGLYFLAFKALESLLRSCQASAKSQQGELL